MSLFFAKQKKVWDEIYSRLNWNFYKSEIGREEFFVAKKKNNFFESHTQKSDKNQSVIKNVQF